MRSNVEKIMVFDQEQPEFARLFPNCFTVLSLNLSKSPLVRDKLHLPSDKHLCSKADTAVELLLLLEDIASCIKYNTEELFTSIRLICYNLFAVMAARGFLSKEVRDVRAEGST